MHNNSVSILQVCCTYWDGRRWLGQLLCKSLLGRWSHCREGLFTQLTACHGSHHGRIMEGSCPPQAWNLEKGAGMCASSDIKTRHRLEKNRCKVLGNIGKKASHRKGHVNQVMKGRGKWEMVILIRQTRMITSRGKNNRTGIRQFWLLPEITAPLEITSSWKHSVKLDKTLVNSWFREQNWMQVNFATRSSQCVQCIHLTNI